MTLQEFKAWFEGFSENLDGPPDEKKWGRIKTKIAEINGAITSYPVFVEKYLPYRYYDYTWYGRSVPMNGVSGNGVYKNATTGFLSIENSRGITDSAAVVSVNDWREAGRAEAQSLGAASAA